MVRMLSGFVLGLMVFGFTQTVKANFADVDVTHPYFHSIEALQLSGVVEGHQVEDRRMFFPLSKINRAEALKLILLSTETESSENEGEIFPDVLMGQWFANYVNTAYQLEIVQGFPDGNFYPAVKVRRAEFIKMLFEALEVPVPGPAEEELWFDPYLILATEYRLLPGGKDPNGVIDRGEAAEIIYRAAQVAGNEFKRKYVFSGAGLASYYNEGFAGRPTASGEIYDPNQLTAAHRTLPFGTRLKVSNEAGDFVVVRITDRGPYHKQRILDLSQAAFERLASVGTGVLAVEFEVFSDPKDEIKTIPEAIRPLLSDTTRQAEVPDEIEARLRETLTTDSKQEVVVVAPIPEKSVMYDQPIFGESVSSVATDFFPEVMLRRTLAQKLPQGLVFELAGTSLSAERFKEVTVFLQHQETGEQTHFTAPVSGTNFVVPVYFFKTGTFDLGIVFDDDRESRVAEIEVAPYPRERKLPASDVSFASDIEVNVTPEEDRADFRWASGDDRLTKMVFSQGTKNFEVVLEGGLSYFSFPYEWFEDEFAVDKTLAIDLYQALSADGSLFKQRTNWKKVTFKNFDLVRGFPDAETAAVSVKSFQRFYRAPQSVNLKGKILDTAFTPSDMVFVTAPDGLVETTSLWRNGDDFSFSFNLETEGRYIFEIISDQGDILFNRAVFVGKAPVLPVMAAVQTVVKQNSYPAIYDWINRIREKQKINTLLSSSDLHQVAQAYAQRMANEGFIGHVAPDGSDPAARLEGLNLRSFAENVSYGSNLNLALSGLENSGSHRKNILSTRWARMGVGLAQNEKGEFYVVQIFAS